ncbi:MAG: hypothetical protein RMY62_006160 [Nostoc sp. ZfuVER08]|nr:hypothetical protein [Nostoc sp. ZfuVER08]
MIFSKYLSDFIFWTQSTSYKAVVDCRQHQSKAIPNKADRHTGNCKGEWLFTPTMYSIY